MDVPAPEEMLRRLRGVAGVELLLGRLEGAPAVYVVGGVVRDALLGGGSRDIDLVIEGDAAELAQSLGLEVRSHDRFGTCTARADGLSFDLARSRRERYAHPGALPEVEPAPLAEDLRRRDFTVNALAVALNGPQAGELSAPPGALEDLAAGRLRVLHDASFRDDPTRLLRLARYAARLGFEPDARTWELARAAIAGGALETVSGERIGAELRLLAGEPDPLAALGWLERLGIDGALEPGFGLGGEEALARRALELLPADGRPGRLALALAGRRLAPGALSALLARLAFPAAERDGIVAAAGRAGELAQRLGEAAGPAAIASAVDGAAPEAVALAGALGPGAAARRWLDELRHVRLEIGGDDLLLAGIPAGPAIGHGL